MIRAAIYARYSSDNQREESIAGQLRECRAYAERNGFKVVKEYTDSALTATSDRRPGFQQMITDSGKNIFDVVVVWKLDRFSRNRYDSAVYRKKLKDSGVKLVSAMERIADGPEGVILEGLLEAMAEYYSANLSENIRRGMYDSALERKMLRSFVLGYRKGPDGRYEIDPATAPIVRRIFEEYTSGKPRSEIIAGLNADGLRTAKGNLFTKNSLYTVLKNDSYIGMYRYRDIEDPHGIPAILETDLFEKAQTMIKTKSFTKKRADLTGSECYELVTKIFCGECGRPMTGESARSKTGRIYKYYSCTGMKSHQCDKTRVDKDALENAIAAAINREILTDDRIEGFARAFEENQKELTENTALLALQNELQDTERRIRNMNKAIEEGIFGDSTLTRLRELEGRQAELTALIAKEQADNPPITADMLRDYFRDLREKADLGDACQSQILDIFLRRIYVWNPQKKNGPFKAVFEISLTGSAGEPVAYETMLSKSSSMAGEVEISRQVSNSTVICGTSVLLVTTMKM